MLTALNRRYLIEEVEGEGNSCTQWSCTNNGVYPAEMDKKTFRKMFPQLARELDTGDRGVGITAVRSDPKTGERASSGKFASYMPDVIDFLRRCDTEQQAEEIICYLEGRGEISHDYARRLTNQLKKKGVRSFGSKKEDDYYLKQARAPEF